MNEVANAWSWGVTLMVYVAIGLIFYVWFRVSSAKIPVAYARWACALWPVTLIVALVIGFFSFIEDLIEPPPRK